MLNRQITVLQLLVTVLGSGQQFHFNAFGLIGKNRIMVMPPRVVTKNDHTFAGIRSATYVRVIVYVGNSIWLSGFRVGASVMFTQTVTCIRILNDHIELYESPETFVIIKPVICTISYQDMFQMRYSAKTFYAVIFIGKDFDMIYIGSATYSTQCETVDFISFTDIGSAVTDRNIFQRAGIVIIIISTVKTSLFGSGNTLNRRFSG